MKYAEKNDNTIATMSIRFRILRVYRLIVLISIILHHFTEKAYLHSTGTVFSFFGKEKSDGILSSHGFF